MNTPIALEAIRKQTEQGLYSEAARNCLAFLKQDPRHIEASLLYGHLAIKMRRIQDAIIIFRKLLAVDPTNSIASDSLAYLYHQTGDYASARDHAFSALRTNPELIESQLVLGAIAVTGGNKGEALRIFDSLRKQVPGELHIEKAYADALMTCGEFELAQGLVQKLLVQHPDDAYLYRLLSSTHRFTIDDPDTALVLSLGNDAGQLSRHFPDVDDQVRAYMALFKVESDIDHLTLAFNYLREAKALRKQQAPHNPADGASYRKQTEQLFSHSSFSETKSAGSPATSPVFIVGMPRSGTTLLERVVSSNPDVVAGGELPIVGQLVQEACAKFGENQHDLAALGRLSPEIWLQLGEEYLRRARRFVGDAQFFTDKMPGNYLHIGFIRSMLPSAKIIHLSRYPVANCLSIYEQDFAEGTPWGNDLTWLGMQYVDYRKMMDYWDELIGDSLISISYESLVSETEATLKVLSRELNLDLRLERVEEAQQQGRILTASRWQARQPMHGASVNRWERLQDELRPLLAALEPILTPTRIDPVVVK